MRLIRSFNNINIKKPTSLTIGNFDGFHLGHQKILTQVKKISDQKNINSAVLSFEPHPRKFFKKEPNANFRINSIAQKIKFLKEFAIDYAIIISFNQNFSQITANDFLREIIVKNLNTKYLSIGHDFVFGKNRLGDINLLKQNQSQLGFKTLTIEPLSINKEICSSSLIRKKIAGAQIAEANNLLGTNFTVNSTVIRGQNLGHKLGYATANIKIRPHIIKPKYGVYQTKTYLPHLDKKFDSITNFGIKPTTKDSKEEFLETHIFNFAKNIYDKRIYIEFIDFIRDEKKFSSIEQLIQQIKEDIKICHQKTYL